MKLLPYENFCLTTDMQPDEVLSQLKLYVTYPKWSFLGLTNRPSTPYKGVVKNDSFKIEKVIEGRDSFNPVISGKILKTAAGTAVCIIMRLHHFVAVFVVVWLGVFSSGVIVLIHRIIITRKLHPEIYFFAGMFLFMYALTMFCFKYENSRSKKFLAALFKANSHY